MAWNTVVSPDSQYYFSSFSHFYHEEDFPSPALLKMDMQGNIIAVHDILWL
jgi:hypothetical protein